MYFHLDSLTSSKKSGSKLLLLQVVGWYHNSMSTSEPEVLVLADDNEIGRLVFYITRSDVESVHGNLLYNAGFDETFTVRSNFKCLTFVDVKSHDVLLTRTFTGTEADPSGKEHGSFNEYYRKLLLNLSLPDRFSLHVRLVYFRLLTNVLTGCAGDWSLKPILYSLGLKKRIFRKTYSPGKLPYKILFFSHNFEFEGAPKVIYNIAIGLMKKGNYEISVASPHDGPAAGFLRASGIRTIVFADRLSSYSKSPDSMPEDIKSQQQAIHQIMVDEKPDLVFVNVLFNYFIVNLVSSMKVPVLWMIHESFNLEDQQEFFTGVESKNYIMAFSQAAFVVFCTIFSRRYYEQFNFRKNFCVIENSLDQWHASSDYDDQKRTMARTRLGLHADEIMVLNVGITVEHKNQELLVKAAELINEKKIMFFLVGARETTPYARKINDMVKKKGLANSVVVVPFTLDTDSYYLAADIFVFTSTNDTYPLVILEAMAYGLPIIATPINGVNEQVKFGINALKADYYDPVALARQIVQLSEHNDIRLKMGRKSRRIFNRRDAFDRVLDAHEKIIRRAGQTSSCQIRNI